MKLAKILIALALIATVWVIVQWNAPRKNPSPEKQSDTPVHSNPKPSPGPSALPDPNVARLRAVRSAIASTPEGHKHGYEFAEKIQAVASLLSTDELLAALDLLDEVGFAIETLCLEQEIPLDRRIAVLNRFGNREDQGISDAIADTAYRFASDNPVAMREWLRQFEPGVGPGQGLEAVFRHLDKTDPAASIAMLCDLDDHEAENIIGYGDGPNLSHLSGRERLALVQTYASDKLREFNLRQTVVWYLAEDDPEDALTYVRELPPGERHATHGRHLIQVMARSEGADFPAIVRRMENELPSEVRSDQTYYVLAEAWHSQSPTAAREWIGELDAGPTRDAAISGFAREPAVDQLAQSYQLVLTMTSPQERQKNTASILRRWIHLDPEAAAAVLPEADITDDDRRSIERNIRTNG